MANNNLVGNMPTENLVKYFHKEIDLNFVELDKSSELTSVIF